MAAFNVFYQILRAWDDIIYHHKSRLCMLRQGTGSMNFRVLQHAIETILG
jgi:hypothetical protein